MTLTPAAAIPRIIDAYGPELVRIRRDIHRHPELGFEEQRTAAIVAERLESWGLTVHRGVGRTGVVGVLRAGRSDRAIGLRADMDALPVQELGGLAHRSTHDGRMHACGHDGHTTMLLGAARYLAATRRFDGTIVFVFQPAEEGAGGAQAMLDDGLLERFPMQAIYGMHNIPGITAGHFAILEGPALAAVDRIEITIHGKGGHGAWPQLTVDPVVLQAQVISALQTLISRGIDAVDSAVLSITQVRAGDAFNVIPETASLGGTLRTFRPEVRARLIEGLQTLTEHICLGFGGRGEVRVTSLFPAVLNAAVPTRAARAAAQAVYPAAAAASVAPLMGSEDFSLYQQRLPGCYAFIGNGTSDNGGCMLHNPYYDFNDEILIAGASYWGALVEQELAAT